MYLGSQMCWLDFGVKKSKVEVTAANDPKTLWTPYLKNNERNITQFWSHMYFGLWMCWPAFGSEVKVTADYDPKTLWTPYLTNQWREFCPILVTDVCMWVGRCADQLLASKVKGQGHSIFVNIWANFTNTRSRMYLGLGHTDWVNKRSKMKVTEGGVITVDGSPSSFI